MRKLFAIVTLSAIIAGPAFAVDQDSMDDEQQVQADNQEMQTDKQDQQTDEQKMQSARAAAVRKAKAKKAAERTTPKQ